MNRYKNPAKYAAIFAFVILAPIAGGYIARTNAEGLAKGPIPVAKDAKPVAPDAVTQDAFTGVLLRDQLVALQPAFPGKVQSVFVRVGQHVRAGEAILELDPAEVSISLKEAKASLHEAQGHAYAAGSSAKAAHLRAARRNDKVGGIALVSAEESAQAQAEAQMARGSAAAAGGQIERSKAHIERLERMLSQTRIVAPFDGEVSQLSVEAGANVHPGETIVRLVGGPGLRVRIAVPEDAASALRGAQFARLDVEGRVAYARIEAIAPEVDAASRAFLVVGTVVSPEQAFSFEYPRFAGKTVRATLSATAPGFTQVPIQAAPAAQAAQAAQAAAPAHGVQGAIAHR
jgi:RND family efflux transporter MFP subunit